MLDALILLMALGVVLLLAISSFRGRSNTPGEQELFDAEFQRIASALRQGPSEYFLQTAKTLGGSRGSLKDIRPGKTPLELLLASPYGTVTVRVPGLTEASLLLEMRSDLAEAEGSYVITDAGESTHLIVMSGNRRVSTKTLPID